MTHPFEYVSKGLEFVDAGRFSEAEKFILKGINEYERAKDKQGVNFALGRLGYCYEKAGLEEKAQETYENSVKLGTDIPATYNSLISILTFKGEIDRAFEVADLYQFRCVKDLQRPAHDLFIQFSSRLIREDKHEAAVSLLRRTLAYFPLEKYALFFWQIRGLIGFAFEKSGNLEEAMNIYRQAIEEGSSDSNTFQRYLINLEKMKDFATAIKFIEKGLRVQKDVAWEADLKKRLQRLRLKTGEISKTAPKLLIEDYSISKGVKNLTLVQQIQFSPQLSFMVTRGNYFYGTTGGKTPKLFCYRVETQEQVWETALDGDPVGLTIENDRLVASTSEANISGRHTKLHFFTLDSKLITIQQLPDVTSEISSGGDRLYAGCRDGNLYAFTTDGEPLWSYCLADTRDQKDDKSSRPCPYYVSAGREIIAFSSYGSLYVLNTNGKLLFQWNVPYLNNNMDVEGLHITMSMAGGPISDLLVEPDGRKVFVSTQASIFEITEGKVIRIIDTSPDTIYHIEFLDNNLIGACGFEHMLIIGNGKVQKRISVSGLGDVRSSLVANRLAIWSGNKLSILTYSGVLLSEIVFVKTINNIKIFDNGQLLVATRYAILFDTTLRNSTPTVETTSKQAPELESKDKLPVLPPKIERPYEENGIPIKWLEERKISFGKGKAFYLGPEGKELTIEQTALNHYLQRGFKGSWTENNYWWEIMALLFWDVIFAKIPGTYTPQFGEFPSRMQDMPLDFFTEDFYSRRKKLIERRFQDLDSKSFLGLVKKTADSELRSSYKNNYGKPCRPIEDWSKFSLDSLSLATQYLKKEQLSLILQRMLENFSENRKGLPDLFLLDSAGKPLLVEVKAENEKIADHQQAWHQFLKNSVHIPVEICRIIDV